MRLLASIFAHLQKRSCFAPTAFKDCQHCSNTQLTPQSPNGWYCLFLFFFSVTCNSRQYELFKTKTVTATSLGGYEHFASLKIASTNIRGMLFIQPIRPNFSWKLKLFITYFLIFSTTNTGSTKESKKLLKIIK